MNFLFSIKNRPLFLGCCILLLCSGILFSSCKSKRAQAETLEHQQLIPKDESEFQQHMSTVLEVYVQSLSAGKRDTTRHIGWPDMLKEAYAAHQYKAFWVSKNVLSFKGKEMLEILGKAEYAGLNKELYQYEKLKLLNDTLVKLQPRADFNLSKQLEAGLTRAFFQMALHLDRGMFADATEGIRSNFRPGQEKYRSLLQTAATQPVAAVLSGLEPQHPMYKRYMQALKTFVATNNVSANPIHIRNPKTDSTGAAADAKKALMYHHYLKDSLSTDAEYLQAVKNFQKDNGLNGDGVVGTNTIKALERDNFARFMLLAVNADRWRKDNITELPERYVWVNLPSLKVRIIEQDTLRLEKNIVIGKTGKKFQTPVLESAINQVVLWPTWTVPQSIIKNEMKSFKGYIVTRIGKQLKVVQPPGPKNALGTVKLLFPNKYSVYMHDTPSKSLFALDARAASHGCVRCQDALEIAAQLMMMDTFKINYDTLKIWRDDTIVTRTFNLKKSIPVYFRYFTAEADLQGQLKFYADVYGRDKDMIQFIFQGRQPLPLAENEKSGSKPIASKKGMADSLWLTKVGTSKKKTDL